MLGVIAGAVGGQQRRAAAIAPWVHSHAPFLPAAFQPARGQVPNEATIRRAWRHADVVHLKRDLAASASRRAPVAVLIDMPCAVLQ
jgi:hypothetical protein